MLLYLNNKETLGLEDVQGYCLVFSVWKNLLHRGVHGALVSLSAIAPWIHGALMSKYAIAPWIPGGVDCPSCYIPSFASFPRVVVIRFHRL
jgi:hypothetical protein